MKAEKTKTDAGLSQARQWLTLRVSTEEKQRVAEQAALAGLSVSEYMRRTVFGGRPIVAASDQAMLRELRRVGGLLKHHFTTVQQVGFTVLENGEVTRARREQKLQPRPQAQDFERATGEKSAQRIAQERGHGIIKNATSWPELHQQLAEKGLRFEKKASGAIIFVGEIAVKASSVDRTFGMGKLCKRLGDFMPAPAAETEKQIDTPPPPLPPEPVSAVNLEEWRQYQEEQTAAKQPAQPNIIEALKARQREERKRILPTLAKHGLHILNIARHFLKLKQREELQQARQAARPVPPIRKPCFETWLRDRGLHVQANRWRHRGRLEKLLPTAPTPTPPL